MIPIHTHDPCWVCPCPPLQLFWHFLPPSEFLWFFVSKKMFWLQESSIWQPHNFSQFLMASSASTFLDLQAQERHPLPKRALLFSVFQERHPWPILYILIDQFAPCYMASFSCNWWHLLLLNIVQESVSFFTFLSLMCHAINMYDRFWSFPYRNWDKRK